MSKRSGKRKSTGRPLRPRRLVVKLGSAAVTRDGGGVHTLRLSRIVADCVDLLGEGTEVIIVSSGAIQAGRQMIHSRTREMDVLQACSAVGQPLLMAGYNRYFARAGHSCAQVLLTHEDMGNRQRYLNVRNTVLRLLKEKVVPVINENDSVSFAEITVGDNDQLAAMVAEMAGADLLVMLTTHDGLFTANPDDEDATPIPEVPFGDPLKGISVRRKSGPGRGGMATKLQAVRKLTPLGVPVVVATYLAKNPVRAALSGGGTLFHGDRIRSKNARKRWLVATARSDAAVRVDEGAYRAISQRASLLPSGITRVEGLFKRGDCIRLLYRGREFAIGLAEYSSRDTQRIMGHGSREIAGILGDCPSGVVIHRNNLVLKEPL